MCVCHFSIQGDFFSRASSEKWEETTFNPIYEDNEIIGVSCFLRDITQRKVASELVRQSVETMSIAQSIAQFGSWELQFNEDGTVKTDSLRLSREICRIFGFDYKKLKQNYETLFEMVHPADREAVKKAVCDAFANKSSFEAEYRIIKANGETGWLKAKFRIAFINGIAAKVIGTAQDITQRKMAEAERTKLLNDLVQRNKDLEQFAYIISHNLRAPVAQVLGLVNVFEMCENDHMTQLKCMQNLSKATKRIDDVIIDLNDILHVRHQINERKTNVVFHQIVHEIEESLRSQLYKDRGFISCHFAVEEFFTLKGYLYSIFYNLISNSLKYRKPGVAPFIEIRSEIKNGKLQLSFRDNGAGINLKQHGQKIFGLYKRFSDEVEGKGIGLYMVKMQVETLGGTISVSSEENEGTEFIISFDYP